MPKERDEIRFTTRLTPEDEELFDTLAKLSGVRARSEILRLALRFTISSWPGRAPQPDHTERPKS